MPIANRVYFRYAYSSAINKSKIQNRYFQPHSINGKFGMKLLFQCNIINKIF